MSKHNKDGRDAAHERRMPVSTYTGSSMPENHFIILACEKKVEALIPVLVYYTSYASSFKLLQLRITCFFHFSQTLSVSQRTTKSVVP